MIFLRFCVIADGEKGSGRCIKDGTETCQGEAGRLWKKGTPNVHDQYVVIKFSLDL